MNQSKANNEIRRIANLVEKHRAVIAQIANLDHVTGIAVMGIGAAVTELKGLATALEAHPPACVHCENPEAHPRGKTSRG